ncbi:2-hydroxyacid dehydrogenase [Sutcliffiella rhizosphaerae]|uniref:Glyoxylate/hydroxypyruvate reductase B n=1 Tax=Sutcliffiella rhizosphaerae TaxID=2880967 RepID=A0ABM8YM73_9BACI|nr:D-glycerate dehydrogenase [Sutcliffiella rhizosphaerae]CAG9621061.1 Glyoxylate/hydroxypyruvate reductase B [Sutcliffiella rhizosphaerae]
MSRPYVFVTRKISEEALAPLKDIADVHCWNSESEAVPEEVLVEHARKADALLTMLSDKIDQSLLNMAPNLKVITNLAVGYDNIDIKAAAEKGIVVCNTPDVLTETTADLTFALLLATARRITESERYVKEGLWKSWSPYLLAGSDVHHKTLGIVGMGNIGQAVAKRANGFGMDVLYHNRSRHQEAEQQLGATYASFTELLRKSDFVVCLTPLTEKTRHLFNKQAFEEMKKSAYFINVGRGQVVDEKALIEALENKEIAGAGLDVFYQEPIEANHPLLKFPQVVAIPHIGSASVETRTTMMELCCANIMAVLKGEQPKNKL